MTQIRAQPHTTSVGPVQAPSLMMSNSGSRFTLRASLQILCGCGCSTFPRYRIHSMLCPLILFEYIHNFSLFPSNLCWWPPLFLLLVPQQASLQLLWEPFCQLIQLAQLGWSSGVVRRNPLQYAVGTWPGWLGKHEAQMLQRTD